ncbi:MAG: hypothetical protein R6T99_03115 [Bacteroidales bacterium]
MPGKRHLQPIFSDSYYHIYNRAVRDNTLFYTESDMIIFLRKFRKFVMPYLNVLGFCLLPNHFHLIVKTVDSNDSQHFPSLISEQFRKLFISHAVDINREEIREGTLFERPYRRIRIESENYLKYLLFYVHYNPEKHNIAYKFQDYRYSSYSLCFRKDQSIIDREFVSGLFNNDYGEYLEFHKHHHDEKIIKDLILE